MSTAVTAYGVRDQPDGRLPAEFWRAVPGADAAGAARPARLGNEPVRPPTVARDLGMHLLRFVLMADVLPAADVLGFRASLAWTEQAISTLGQ